MDTRKRRGEEMLDDPRLRRVVKRVELAIELAGPSLQENANDDEEL